MSDKRLLLIDGNSVAFRAFFALYNSLNRFTSPDGLHTNAIYGFNTMLDTMLKEVDPTHALVAFDAGKTTFRTEKFEDYKGGRAKTPPELSEQLPFLRKLLAARGLEAYELKNFEADDIIGTMAKKADEQGFETTIFTGDRDLTQLASDHTQVAVSRKGVSDVETYTPAYVKEKLGVTPRQIIEIKGLQGDTSDNYPGVTGIGPKTAVNLIQEYDTIDGVYEHLDDITAKKMKANLIADEAQAFRARDLATIRRDAPVDLELADLAFNGMNRDELVQFYQQMNFQQALKKLAASSDEDVLGLKPVSFTVLNQDNLTELSTLKTTVSFYLEMPEANYHTSSFAGFVIGTEDQWFVSRDVELLHEPILTALLSSDELEKNVFDAKRTYVGLNRLGVSLKNVHFDLLLASYLLDTNENSNDLGALASQHGYNQVQTDEEVYGRGAKRAIPDDDQTLFEHLTRKGIAIETLTTPLFKELQDNEQTDLYSSLELPIANVLAQMEIAGIKVDTDRLSAMQSQFTELLAQTEQTIYQEAGEEFNIGSPKQLSDLLFGKLGLTPIKKTKTGYSTSVDVLEKLAAEAPIVENILKYRQISKILSTYIEGLLKVVHSTDQKIHTRYLQTLTQTGRLSSVDPNLQNIPIRTEEGRRIRQAFVPSHEGWEIFSSDYSQIELRVLAHITHDKNLQEAFKEDEDIHESTARRIFRLNPDEAVTPDIRRQAKAVNFGIVYGISDFGLSQNIGITRKQARQFIDTYFEEYPGVKAYMDDIVKTARERGYVETIAHRRRYLPDINSSNFNQRSFAERTAMNTPIQGSAADIIKIAMIKMQEALKDLKATMLLQVHDELIFEAPREEIAQLEQVVPRVMDSAVNLEIPLKVESHHGLTWFDAK